MLRNPRLRRPLTVCIEAFLLLALTYVCAFGQVNLLVQKDGSVAGDKWGYAVAGAGDINNDGTPDYIVGAPNADPGGVSGAGSAFVYSGANGALLYQKNGTTSGASMGYWVSGAGDMNGDGRNEFIIASRSYVYVFSGANGTQLYSKVAGGPVAGLGDANGDGRADFIVSNLTQSFVYSGATGALLYQYTGGTSVASLGDVNGDGRADFIVGDQYADPGVTNGGSAYVYSGATGNLLYQKDGAVDYDLFGFAVAGVGDVNGDGRSDFMVGARLADVGGLLNCGGAYVYSGANGALLYQKSGPADKQLGYAVSGAGDVNGDGKADFMASTLWNLSSAGSVFLYSGANGSLIQQIDGKNANDNFGAALAAVGDINKNGRSEFLIGAPLTDPSLKYDAGTSYLYGDGSGGGTTDPCASDVTPPVIQCVADKRITCGQSVVFDQPTATDNCDPNPTIQIVSTTQTSGPGTGETTHTRTWRALDASGNASAQCSQDVVYYCVTIPQDRALLTESGVSCASFYGNTAASVTDICYSTKSGKISKCTPSGFVLYSTVTAPSSSFTVDLVQTRNSTSIPFFGIARNGVTVYDENCAVVGAGSSPSAGQARATISGATAGRQYIIAVKYATSSLNGTMVGSGLPNVHFDFKSVIGGTTVAQDADGIDVAFCGTGSGQRADKTALEVQGSYPNPFNPSTTISYSLGQTAHVQIEIYSLLGQKVRTLTNGTMSSGDHSVVWDGRDETGSLVASGIYFCNIMTTEEQQVVKLNLIK